jgi:pimeloyl-ACP methyl ester carboxylesterase
MRELDTTVTADDGLVIAGTLTLPDGEGPHPAMVLLSPGQLDREGNTRRAPLELGRPLAAALAEHGVASYRFDRRGVGATHGDWLTTGFFDHRRDAAAVLRAIAARSDISTVGAIGYSEGALHAAWLAAHAGAAAVVLLGCPARSGAAVYLRWAERLRREDIPPPVRLVLRLLRRTVPEQVARVNARIKASTGDVARVYGFRIPARQYREFLDYDPAPDLAAVRVPVLAITGANDRNVDPDDLDVIAQLVAGPVDTRRFPELSHLLRRDPGPSSARTYREQFRRPVDPQLLQEIATWSAAQLGAPGPQSYARDREPDR